MNRDRHNLQLIFDHLKYIKDFTFEGREHFLKDLQVQFAVVRAYEVIGGTVKRLSLDFREKHPQVDWRKLTAFRDFLSHHYEEVVISLV